MRLLVSACLLGCPCRYDGQNRRHPEVEALLERHTLFPVCPEQLGGLPTPRAPAERVGNAVRTRDGADVTDAYRRGAEETLRLYQLLRCEAAVLKERSPACGSGEIYDGSFSGTLRDGYGAAAERLAAYGAPVYGESRIEELSAPQSERPAGELSATQSERLAGELYATQNERLAGVLYATQSAPVRQEMDPSQKSNSQF